MHRVDEENKTTIEHHYNLMLYNRFRYTMDQITVLKATHNTNLKCGSHKVGVRQFTSNTSVIQHDLTCFFRSQDTQYIYPPIQKMLNGSKEHQKTDLQRNYMTNFRLNIKAILYHFKYHQIN